MKQVPEKLRPWLIVGWFVALFGWNAYSMWSLYPITADSDPDNVTRLALAALSMFFTLGEIFLSMIVIGAILVKWKW